jgi:hypothetical protein
MRPENRLSDGIDVMLTAFEDVKLMTEYLPHESTSEHSTPQSQREYVEYPFQSPQQEHTKQIGLCKKIFKALLHPIRKMYKHITTARVTW